MNTVKHKMKNIMKKMISVVITLAMLVQYLPVNWLQDVFAADKKPISVSFVETTGLNKGGDRNYLMSSSQTIAMMINLVPNWNVSDGYAMKGNVQLDLPWFYYENDIIKFTTDPVNFHKENPDIPFIGGVEAQFSSLPSSWAESNPSNNDWGWGSDYATNPSTKWRKTSLVAESFEKKKIDSTQTFNVEFRFFTIGDNKIPENASASIALGASYKEFYNKSDVLVSSEGYTIETGRDPTTGENQNDIRLINLVNSNLDWKTSVRTISEPVLWDQYNYAVFAVDIENNSKDDSDIDYFKFDLTVPSKNIEQYGVLDDDMVAWKVGANGEYESNSDASNRENSYGGIYGKGGALIWDVTGETESTNFDLETFLKNHDEKSQFTYTYPRSGRISVGIGGKDNSAGKLEKGKKKTYYVAIPFVNNFGDQTTKDQTVDLLQTIYYGGRNLAWSKTESGTFKFDTQKTSFEHDKYLLDDTKHETKLKEIALGQDFSYYLDKFKNTSNTPVFNAYTVDTLPEKFNLTSLTVEMNNGTPDDWFKTDSTKGVDLADIISLKFKDKNGKETWVPLKQLGVTVTQDGNQWKLDNKNINDAITDYLNNNSGYTFERDVKFEFKERIASNEALDGRIIVTGNGKYLIDYKNIIHTSYEKWTWSSVPIDGQNEKADYIKTTESIEKDADAVARGKHAQPQLSGYGVIHEKASDNIKQPQEVDVANNNTAIRFTLGNNTASFMTPSKFTVDGLVNSSTGAGLAATSIRLSKDLVEKSKIKDIVLTNRSGNKFTINYSTLTTTSDGSILIPSSKWSGQLYGVEVNFDEFPGSVSNAQTGCYIEINGMPNAVGTYNFNGVFTTEYGITGVTEDVAKAKATLNVKCADPKIAGFGVLHDSTKDQVNKTQQVSLGDKNSAIRFGLGNISNFEMNPSEFTVSNLLTAKSGGAYAGLEASSIYLSPKLVSSSKIDFITLTDVNGKTYTIKSTGISKESDGSILIPSSAWEEKISKLRDVKVNFEEFGANIATPNASTDCYIEINGMPNATGTLSFTGEFTTKYNSHTGLVGTVNEVKVSDVAKLNVRSIEPTIDAEAVYKTTTSKNTPAPNKSSKVDKTNPTYYEFKVGNKSTSKAGETHLTFDLDSVQNVSKSGTEVVKGFDTEKFVIKAGYDKAMAIEKIEFFDYGQDPSKDKASFIIDKNDLRKYIVSDDIVIDNFPSSMKRITTIRVVTSSFESNITGNDCVVAQIYGNTDAYNNYYTSNNLKASLEFKPIGDLYSASDSLTGSAAFNVTAGKLDVDNSLYQEEVTSEAVSKTNNTDKDEQTLGVPYGRDFVYRVASWNTGDAYLDDVETKITVPTLGNDGSGFHATSLTIYKDLLEQYADFDGKNTFESIEFESKPSSLTSLTGVNYKIKMTYNSTTGELESETGKKYTATADGKFDIPLEDITNNNSGYELQTITLKGKSFVINGDQKGKIEPYVEIGGWSDSDIGDSNILETNATHYLDGMEEEANKAYRILSNDTAKAYQSKMYYDTTIVAGYNDNEPSKRFSKTSTPVEHVRLSDCSGDNSELEVGYKGLGSYAVDFRQYLNVGSNLPQNENMSSQDLQNMSYIKLSSLNTAANIEMNVTLPKDYFDTYYLKVNKRVKQYIKEIVVTRKDGSSYTIDKAALADKFIHDNPLTGEGEYARINLLTSGDDFTNDNVFSEKESDYYKQPTSEYDVSNPIEKAKIVIDINQEATTKDTDGNTVANVPDYGTWWDEKDDTTKYMFEFGGRFYKTGVANASVSSTVTIGGENNKQHKDSKQRTLTGSPEHPSGIDENKKTTGWSYLNYYYRTYYGGGYSYKANHLYSLSHAIVVRDFDRVSKGATSSYTVKSNTNAKIADDNKYLINFTRSTRCYSTYQPAYQYQYEAGTDNKSWYYQDPDDWINKLSYADQVDIEDTLGKIVPDETYDYKGTLTTGLQIHKELANYFKDGKAALTLTLGTGETVAEQKQNPVTKTFTKDDLVYDSQRGYYVIKFNNDNDKSNTGKNGYDSDTGTYYLDKYQYVLSFKITMYDIQGNGEYNSEIGNKYYKYTDADGTEQQDQVDKFGLTTDDIIVNVKPYTVYGVDTVADATNKIETKTYLDDKNDKNTNVMDSNSGYQNYSSAYIMGYRIPFNVGYQLDSLGADAIDSDGKVSKSTDPNLRNISDYHTTDGNTYNKIGGTSYKEEQNKTPTNAQFGVKVYNQTDSSNDEHKTPARIRDVTTTDSMNQYYRMRNIYLPIQWINDGTDSDPSSKTTDNGQWFKLSELNVKINNQSIQFVPTKDANGKMVLQADKTGTALQVDTINLDTTKNVNGQECYVINIENFVRQNYNAGYTSLVSGPTNDDLVKVIVNSFSMTFVATHQDFKKDETVMSNGQYLTSTKTNTNNEYSYFYDGVYVDRTKDDFLKDDWTDDSVPTFSREANTFSVGNQSNSGSILPHSIDNNAQPWAYTSDKILSDYYNLRNAVARLQPTLTRERTFNGNSQLFAYDQDATNTNESSKPVEVDQNHLMPYDYVEYTLSATNEEGAEIPLNHTHMSFKVKEGQQIVGWKLVDASDVIDKDTGNPLTATDIKATLKDDSGNSLNDSSGNPLKVKAEKDYSSDVNGDDTHYRTIDFEIGSEGTQIPIGKTVKLCIITQLTDEVNGSATRDKKSFEGQYVNANAYTQADPKHGFAQYYIDKADNYNHRSDTSAYKTVAKNNVESARSYYRYYKGSDFKEFISRIDCQDQLYDNDPLTISYTFTNNEFMFDSQGAKLTVSKIKNDTMHFVDEQTVTVNFLDENGRQGFVLDKIPTVGLDASDNADIYYPADMVVQVGKDKLKTIKVEYYTSDDKKWHTVNYSDLPDITTIHKITSIRWTYFDVPSRDNQQNANNDVIIFDDVTLIGQARYEDIRADKSKVRDDKYKSVDSATITHTKNYEKKVQNDDISADKITVSHEVSLNETINTKQDVYREAPQIILHPQVFDKESDAAATYNENASQKIGYRPNDKYWQKITLINRKMVDANSNTQSARQGRLIEPVIYDKLPTDYLKSIPNESAIHFTWTDVNGTDKLANGNYEIRVTDIDLGKEKDYAGNMIYEKSDLNTTNYTQVGSAWGTKAFDDLDTSDTNTLDTNYTLRKYKIIDKNTNKAITMEIGDKLSIYYELEVVKDNLPMVYVDEDKNLDTTDDRHPAYFPRVGEYYQYNENGWRSNGESYPFASKNNGETTYWREIDNNNRQMDMDYLLHDVGVTATPNNYEEDGIKHDNVDSWEFLKESIVYIPGDNEYTGDNNKRYGGANNVLGDYDISSLKNAQKTIYTPIQQENVDADLPDYGEGKTSLISEKDKNKRDWYELVVKKRTIVNETYNSSAADASKCGSDNWGSETPIVWGENRLHLQKAWLVSASEFVDATLDSDNNLVDNDQSKEHRIYQTTEGDGLTNYPSNPNYYINENRYTGAYVNQIHAATDDNYEVGLEYNEEFTTKLQALNYGDWDLGHGVEFTYTMPRGIEPLIFTDDGQVDVSKLKAEVLESVTGVSSDQLEVNETYKTLNNDCIHVEVLQEPTTKKAKYQAPNAWQDAQSKDTTADYETGDDTTPWVLKITVDSSLSKWFNRGEDRGYKLNLYIPSKVVGINEDQQWYDRLQTRPYVPDDDTSYQDYYYYQILDIDHFEGTTKENMQHNQRYGMDYMWYRGDGYGVTYYYANSQYYYYNGSPNTPYVDGYNIQDREVKLSNGKVTPVKNKDDYGKADSHDRYAQTGTRAIMRKPLLRQWTTVGNDISGNTLSNYYVDTEGSATKLNIHVENKYYWDELGTNYENYYSSSYANGTKEKHSYATDGGGRGTYVLPVITNILPYGVAPVGKKDNKSNIFSTKVDENGTRTLTWDLLDTNGNPLPTSEKDLYDVKVTYEQIAKVDSDGNEVTDKNGNKVTEGRYVVRFYPTAQAEKDVSAVIKSGEGRTFSFNTFVYATPKTDTLDGENKDLQDSYESNYTYISSKLDDFDAIIDDDIEGNPYTVASEAYNDTRYINYNGNEFVKPENRPDALQKTYTKYYNVKQTYGNLPNSKVTDKVNGKDYYVVGQGMTRVEEDKEKAEDDSYIFNIEDYVKDKDGKTIRDSLVLNESQRDFNLSTKETHQNYNKKSSDIAFANTTKIRTSQPSLRLENYVSSSKDEVGKKTPNKDAKGNEVEKGSVEYTYDDDGNPKTDEVTKKFDYGDDVWYTAKLINKPEDENDYARRGSVNHSRFVFSFHLPKAVSITDLPNYDNSADWDQFRDDDFVIEIEHENGDPPTIVTPSQLKNSGFGIRIINKKYTPTSSTKDHTGQIVTYEVTTPQDENFDYKDYSSFVDGYKPAGYLKSGDTLSLKIRTRVDNKEYGVDPSDTSGVDVWTGYYSEAYSTLHTTNGEYIVTDAGKIYDKDDKIPAGETVIYDGYKFNEESNKAYDMSFTKQVKMKWIDGVTDSKDVKDEDGSLEECNDYDQDEVYDENFVYGSSAYINIVKPKATTRIDTSELRRRINDLDADIAIIDDAHIKSSDTMYLRLTKVANDQAKLNQFITSVSIPYYGTNKATIKPATLNDSKMQTEVQEIRTGNWLLPTKIDNYDIYKDHLKVYLYAYLVDDPWQTSGVISPDDSNWTLIGDSNGYALTANQTIQTDQSPVKDQLKGKYIYQLNWVVKMEGFTDVNGNMYTAKNAAINYPVPVGLKLNTADANGQDVDDKDTSRDNISKDVMHDANVVDNCAYVSVATGPESTTDALAKHINFFARSYGKYDDNKYSALTKDDRAGYYIDPELPTLQIDITQAYFKANAVYPEDGGSPYNEFSWDKGSTPIIDTESKTLKYYISMINKKADGNEIRREDNATNPNITVALPYNENLDVNKLTYVEYGSGSYLDDDYISDSSIDSKVPLWTWYIVNEDGTIVKPEENQSVQVTDNTPAHTSKPIAADRKENSKILNFYFTGKLKPGQTLKVEFMTPVERMNANAVSSELLRCKGYISKDGAFDAFMPDQLSANPSAYEYDSQDVNENKLYNDPTLTKMTSAVGFAKVSHLEQSKLVDTEIETNVTGRSAAVNEGGDYTFKVSSKSPFDDPSYIYDNNLIYDVLPYDEDYYAYLITQDNELQPRNSKWNGWLKLDSIHVKETSESSNDVSLTEVDSSQYDVWVGPIVKDGSKYVLNVDSDGKPILPDQKKLQSDTYMNSLTAANSTERNKYFVKLSDLQTYLKNADEDEKEQLTKGVRAIWLQMKDDYKIKQGGRLELSYTMHAPQNLPKYVGDVQVDASLDISSAAQIDETVKDILGKNTALSRSRNTLTDKYDTTEEQYAGVYPDAPSGKGYIGSYVWQDINYNGEKDEAEYEDTYGIGRDLFKEAKYDLNGDGKVDEKDDPGINGVKVELLTEHGRPANKDGEAIQETEDGKYLIINDETGQPELNDAGSSTERYRYSTSGPATYTTESDYYGNKGYFVFSNLKPGKYNLRYTLPDGYTDYSVTTKQINTTYDQKSVIVYRNGQAVYGDQTTANAQTAAYPVENDKLVAQTAQSIEVTAVEEDATKHKAYDKKVMSYDLGVGRTNLYKGTAWKDETVKTNGDIEINGYMDDDEERLAGIRVEAYEVDQNTSKPISNTPALDADGNPASYVTKGSDVGDLLKGEYQFRLVPGKSYIIKAFNESGTPLKPTSPINSNDPTADTKYNDLLLQSGGQLVTNRFDVPYIIGKDVKTWKDYPKNGDGHTIDLGFVDSSRGFIGEFVWDDANYNGIQDYGESPIKNVTVTLEQYYYYDGKWIKLNKEEKTKTSKSGIYKFTVSTYHTVNGENYLMGYKVRIDSDDNKNLFETSAPTLKDQTTDGTQSDLDEQPTGKHYYLTDDIVIMAKTTSSTTQDSNVKDYNGVSYDIGNAETMNFDAGFKDYESGKLDGIVWLDDNYDGIRDSNETIADGTKLNSNQLKLKEVKAQIKGYYYDNGTWKNASNDWTAPADAKLVLADDGYYHYTFDDLPTEIQINGKTYLMGYKVTLDNIDNTLKPTLSYQTDSDKDSNLVVRNKNYTLMKPNEYAVIAKELSANDTVNTGTTETVNGTTYDMLKHQNVKDYDAGLTGIENSGISGQVWKDQNYDGIQDAGEDPIKDINVRLIRYTVTEGSDGKLKYTEDKTFTRSTKTDDKGAYNFTGLEASPNDGQSLYAYQVVIDPTSTENRKILEGGSERLGITKYHKGKDSTKDSDWSNNGTLIDNSGEYLILLNKETASTPDDNKVLGYDIVKGKSYDNLNAGATPYQNASISGNIFDDKDYNGLLEKDDKGYEGINVILTQYEKVGDDYIPTGAIASTVTDEQGNYLFDNLPTNGYDITGDRVIYAYSVSIDEIPDDYAITKYHKEGKRYSNIDPTDLALKDKSNNPYIILAKKSEDDKLAQYLDGYDLIENNSKKDYDGGITKFHNATITGTIFDDKDYNGLLGKDDKGYQGINVILTQYQKVGDEYFPTGMIDSVETDENGKYTFSEIPTYGTNEEGERVLYAYRVTLDEDSLPEGYGVTRYRVNDKDESSKLSSKDYELITNKENHYKDSQEPFIILAEKADDPSVPYYTDGYDVVGSNSVKELNGGISKIQTGSISGKIFNDDDYDGLSTKDDKGFEGIEISLKQYYLKDNEYIETENTFTCKTTSDGSYKFDQLPTNGIENDEHVIYYYKAFVDLDTLPSGYAITKYHVGKDDTKDSDLLSKSGELLGKDQYMVLVDKADKDNVQSVVNGYDIITAKDIKFLDGGLTSYNLGSIEGTLWIDANRNGIIDQNESRLSHRKMVLKGYYYKDNQWIEESSLDSEVETDENGKYIFSHLPASITKDEQTYLVGYQVFIAELPKDKEITEYLKNNGKNDSKLKKGDLRLIPIQYDKDGYLIVADRFDEDNINNQSYNYEGYNIIKAIDIKDMNAGFYDPDKPVMTGNSSPIVQLLQRIKTGDNVSIMGYVLLGLISCGIIVLIVFKKRKDNE